MHGLSAISIIAASLCALLYCSETALTGLLVAQNNFATAPTNLSRYVNENAVIYLKSPYVPANITWRSKFSNAYDSIALFGNIMTHGDFLDNTKFIRVPHTTAPPTKVTLASLLKDCFSKAYTTYSYGKTVRGTIHNLTAGDVHANKDNTNYETIASTYLCYRKNDYDAAICVHTTPRNYHLSWKSQMKSSIESALDSFFSGLLFDKRQAIQPAPEPIKPITLRMVLSKMLSGLNADHIRKIRWLMIAVFTAGIFSIKGRQRTVAVDHNNDDNGNDDNDNVDELRESNNNDVDPQEPTSGELDDNDDANKEELRELDNKDVDPQEPTSGELDNDDDADDDESQASAFEDADPQEPTSGELDADDDANDDELREMNNKDVDPQEPTSGELDIDDDANDKKSHASASEDADPQDPTSGELDDDDDAKDDESQASPSEDADPQEPTSEELDTETDALTSNMTDDFLEDEDESFPLSETSENQRSTQDDYIKERTDASFTSDIPSELFLYNEVANDLSELENMRLSCEDLNESTSAKAFISAIEEMDQKVCSSDKTLQRLAAAIQAQWHSTLALKRNSLSLAADLGDSRLKQICYLFYGFIGLRNLNATEHSKLEDIPELLDCIKNHELANGSLSKRPAEIMSRMQTETVRENLRFKSIEAELEYLGSFWEVSKSFNLDIAHFVCADVGSEFHNLLTRCQSTNVALDSDEHIQSLHDIYNRFVESQEPFTATLRQVSQQIRRIQMLIRDVTATYEAYIAITGSIVEASKQEPEKYTEQGLVEFMSSIDPSRHLENLFYGLLNTA